MKYLSVCSGIGADAVAWGPLGWECAAFSETNAQASAVLKHHYPETPNHGDFTTIKGDEYGPIDLIAGGTPCQPFSVAGRRKGMADYRGNLALEFCLLVGRALPEWIIWENVPGVFSIEGGRAFRSICKGLGELGYGLAWRVLDAQYVRVEPHPRGVPQRRRRVFVVGHIGDWRPSVAVLFEPEGLRWHPPPRREKGKDVAGSLSARTSAGGGLGTDFECGGGLVAFSCKDYGLDASVDVSHTLRAMQYEKGNPNGGGQVAVAFDARQDPLMYGEKSGTLNSKSPQSMAVASGRRVRRITPLEAERLMGFADCYTKVPYRGIPLADGPRYRLLGNSIATNVLRWLADRISLFNEVTANG